MQEVETSAITLLLALGLAISAMPIIIPRIQAANPSPETTFSIMQISDTQYLSQNYSQLFSDTTSWIVNNSANYNLKMVLHTGDVINYTSSSSLLANEWANANASMSKLFEGGIPYAYCTGNHDVIPFVSPNGTMSGSSYLAFSTSYLRSKPYWVSDFNNKSTAVKFTVNNLPFLIINLEYVAQNPALAWMKGLLDNNHGCNVIVTTHLYLNNTGGYGVSIPQWATWVQNLKSILSNYPNVFLTLSGHFSGAFGSNMTRADNREEIFFDHSQLNNLQGAASVRIYTFNLTSKRVNVSTYSVGTQSWLTDAYNQFSFDVSVTGDWTLVNDARPVKAYPDLREYVWQKDARMPPNGQYDKIGLHRLVKTGTTPKGVVFLTNCPMWGAGEQRISNPATDNWTKYENFSQAIYWANRGFDVYAIDYRTHFAPKDLNASQYSFAADWGLDVWISDIKEAAEKVKAVSGADKFFISGECSGGMMALNYATKYWKTDLKGIILLDPNFFAQGYPVVGRLNETNTYNLTSAVNNMYAAGNFTMDPYAGLRQRAAYALANPTAPAQYPPGTPLSPATNPATNQSWASITEWWSYILRSLTLAGNTGNVTQCLNNFVEAEWLPYRIQYESMAMTNWVNCPYLTYDYNDHYNEIGVPLLAFDSGLFSNRTGALRFINGINSTDFTAIMLPTYGHLDVYMGTNSARDVSQPALAWMLNELGATPRATVFSSATVMTGWTWNFFVHSIAGATPYTFQWYEGTTPISGQTFMVLSVTKNSPGVYNFYCKVTDSEGATTNSNNVTLTVFS